MNKSVTDMKMISAWMLMASQPITLTTIFYYSLPTTSDEGIGNDSADDVSEEILLSGRVKALKALFEELVH